MTARLIVLLLMGATVSGACDGMESSFFRPASETSPDVTPPRFSNPSPGPEVTVVNTTEFTLEVTDPAAEGGVASGVDPSAIEATRLGAGPLPVSVTPPLVTIDVSAVPDGPVQIAVSTEDRAGNRSLYLFSNVLDATPPTLRFPAPGPPSVIETDDGAVQVPVRVRVADEPHPGTGTVEARTPGADGTCGTADDGTLPSEVLADPVRPLGGVGVTTIQFVLTNPLSQGDPPRTDVVCWVATATDTALAPDGSEAGNTASIAARTTITWRAPTS